jgi:NAD(P)-dependent dehydrogenase (short-subunit alcohol dehydrogenase family)
MSTSFPPRPAAIVTGAAGGIGRALVCAFQQDGYRTIALDRIDDLTPLDTTAYVRVDLAHFVADEVYAGTALAEIRHELKGSPLRALVNNAAVQILAPSESLDRASWAETLNVNLLAPFFLSQAFLPELEAGNGCVINISSIHARLTKRNFVAYATSKAALSGMTRALAVDLGPKVRVNAIEPAAIETAMLKNGFEGKPELYAQLAECHPQKRFGQPEDVARLALLLAGGSPPFLHGTCIGLDGGISHRLYDPNE